MHTKKRTIGYREIFLAKDTWEQDLSIIISDYNSEEPLGCIFSVVELLRYCDVESYYMNNYRLFILVVSGECAGERHEGYNLFKNQKVLGILK